MPDAPAPSPERFAAYHAHDRAVFVRWLRMVNLDPNDERVTYALEGPMRELLERAQNPPEHGGLSDGSFSEAQWTAARDALVAIREARRQIKALLGASST